mgnify:CR=1 FL=1
MLRNLWRHWVDSLRSTSSSERMLYIGVYLITGGLGGIGIWQLLIILLIVVMLFGTKRLKNLGSDLGGALKGFKNAMGEDEKEQEKDQTGGARLSAAFAATYFACGSCGCGARFSLDSGLFRSSRSGHVLHGGRRKPTRRFGGLSMDADGSHIPQSRARSCRGGGCQFLQSLGIRPCRDPVRHLGGRSTRRVHDQPADSEKHLSLARAQLAAQGA